MGREVTTWAHGRPLGTEWSGSPEYSMNVELALSQLLNVEIKVRHTPIDRRGDGFLPGALPRVCANALAVRL